MTITNKKAVTFYASTKQHQALLDLCLELGFTDTRRQSSKYPISNLSAFFQAIADNSADTGLQRVLKRLKEKADEIKEEENYGHSVDRTLKRLKEKQLKEKE